MNKKIIILAIAIVILAIPIAYSQGFVSEVKVSPKNISGPAVTTPATTAQLKCSDCGFFGLFCTLKNCEAMPNCEYTPGILRWWGSCTSGISNATQAGCSQLNETECRSTENCSSVRDSKGTFIRCAQSPVYNCLLSANNKTLGILNSYSDCESLFIALQFDNKVDLLRLINSVAQNKIETADLNFEKVTIYYKSGNSYDYFSNTLSKLSSNKCENISFFGIRLFCFNGVVAMDKTLKNNNLQYIIPDFSVIKYTSNINHENLLINQNTNAYKFILDNGITYYDASNPSFYGETLERVKCGGGYGSANYQIRGGASIVFVCDAFRNSDKTQAAGILYHESNHKYQVGHAYNINCGPGNTGDRDFRSVYGAHINYLFSMSQNSILSCKERQYAFDQAMQEMTTKLCQKPTAPHTGYTRPVC